MYTQVAVAGGFRERFSDCPEGDSAWKFLGNSAPQYITGAEAPYMVTTPFDLSIAGVSGAVALPTQEQLTQSEVMFGQQMKFSNKIAAIAFPSEPKAFAIIFAICYH
jgi:hypothetical protein